MPHIAHKIDEQKSGRQVNVKQFMHSPHHLHHHPFQDPLQPPTWKFQISTNIFYR